MHAWQLFWFDWALEIPLQLWAGTIWTADENHKYLKSKLFLLCCLENAGFFF
jgi:hypothetical protein